MDWLKPWLLVIAFTGGLVSECYGRSSPYFELVLRYEQCVLNRLNRGHFFLDEHKGRIVKIVKETNRRMHLLYLDPRNAFDARTMLRLFSTVLTNMVIDNDIPINPQRRDAYISVIETCSLPFPRQIGEELVHEVNQMFVSLENAKSARNGGNQMPELSRRRETFSESPSLTTPDDHVKQRLKRSPQTESFSSFEGWQPTETLQTVLSNILMNSNVFLNVFKAGISRRDALYYARNMIEIGLGYYHFSVIQEAVNAVANAISAFSFRPVALDYAFAISSSIASVLDTRQLSFYADGVGIGNGLVSQLQWMLNNKTPVNFPTSSDGAMSSFSWATSSGSISSPQRRVLISQVNPENVETKQSSDGFSSQRDSKQFQNDLTSFLYQSNKIKGLFCNGPFEGIFEMVNEALSEYSLPISTTAATIITDSLTSMSSDLACAQFGNVIAETITNILSENNLLKSANARLITEKMASNINLRQDSRWPVVQNQKDSPSEVFSSSFSGSQQEPPFFSEFSFPEKQPSAIPEIPLEPKNPSSRILPVNPTDATNVKDSSRKQVLPFESSDSVQFPAQQTKVMEDFPLNPSFEPAFPKDYIDASTDTSISTGQRSSSDSNKPGSGADDFGDQRFESPIVSSPINNPLLNSSILLDSTMPLKDDRGNPQGELEKSESEANAEFEIGRTNRTVYSEDTENISTSTTVNIVTTITPYPYTTTSKDRGNVAETLLGDIYASLRTLNSSSDGDKQLPISYESSTTESTDSSAMLVTTPVPNVPMMTPDEAKRTTVMNNGGDESHTTQKLSEDLEPSFWPTAPPNSNDELSIDENRNGTQSSDYVSEGELELRDPTLVFAEHVSEIASSSIALIRSGNANLQELCNKSNDFAAVVDIPPLDVCNEMALVDFLLNVLKAVSFILRSV